MQTIYNAEYYIKNLNLLLHPEGGYYRELYRSEIIENFQGYKDNSRNLSTSIYYLLESKDVSKFHQLKSDEIWYYHSGSPTNVYIIDNKGLLNIVKLGLQVDLGEHPQVIIPKGSIFGASVVYPDSFSLFGCMVAPGFDFKDFILFTKNELLDKYPLYSEIINRLT